MNGKTNELLRRILAFDSDAKRKLTILGSALVAKTSTYKELLGRVERLEHGVVELYHRQPVTEKRPPYPGQRAAPVFRVSPLTINLARTTGAAPVASDANKTEELLGGFADCLTVFRSCSTRRMHCYRRGAYSAQMCKCLG